MVERGLRPLEHRFLRTLSGLQEKMAKEPTAFLVSSEKTREIENWPPLVPGEKRVRVDPLTGELGISSWRVIDQSGEKISPDGVTILMPQGRGRIKGSARQVWSRYPNVETAIRSVIHILEKYDKKSGAAIINTLNSIEIVREILRGYRTGEINPYNLDEIAERVADELDKVGLSTATKPNKKRLKEQIEKAVGRDSLKRFNPLIGRTRAVSAWLKLVRELLVGEKVRGKYSRILDLLLKQRETERDFISQVVEVINLALEPEAEKNLVGYIEYLRLIFFTRNLDDQVVKTAPYRKPAMVAHYWLFRSSLMRDDADKEKFEKLIEQITGPLPLKLMRRLVPIDRLKDKKKLKARLIVARDMLQKALNF